MPDEIHSKVPAALTTVAHDRTLALLLESRIPARLAWVAGDGSPRIAPMWFTWTGRDLVVSAFAGARKLADLVPDAPVVVCIDSEDFPYRSVTVRGIVSDAQPVDGLTPEYETAAARYLGEALGRDWCDALRPEMAQVRITIRPTSAVIADLARDSPFFSSTAREQTDAPQ